MGKLHALHGPFLLFFFFYTSTQSNFAKSVIFRQVIIGSQIQFPVRVPFCGSIYLSLQALAPFKPALGGSYAHAALVVPLDHRVIYANVSILSFSPWSATYVSLLITRRKSAWEMIPVRHFFFSSLSVHGREFIT